MILNTYSNTSFLSEPGSNIRAGGYHYLSTASADPNNPPLKKPPLNGPANFECTTMRNVKARAMEAELGDIFVNFQRGVAMRMALVDMGHAQPPTPEVTDSATGYRFINNNILQRRSRATYIRLNWVRDRVRQGQFQLYRMAGEHNIADYFTKHHPTSHN